MSLSISTRVRTSVLRVRNSARLSDSHDAFRMQPFLPSPVLLKTCEAPLGSHAHVSNSKGYDMKTQSQFRVRGILLRTGTALGLAALLTTSASAQMPMADMKMDAAGMHSMMANWPESARKAADDMMKKYGMPQEVTASTITWRNNGPWKYTTISKWETPHKFPAPHPDVREQGIAYRVPLAMYDDLAMYDGSVTVDRTQGMIAARCDMEGNNFLALNLANDVATGKKTVEAARAYYAKAVGNFKKSGQMDPYMMKLQFPMMSGETGDTDKTVL